MSQMTQNQPSKLEKRSSLTEKNDETTIMIENPSDLRINESTESVAETSVAETWKRINEDDNYQPTYAPSTSAPLAAVLQ